ncbi:hypothetical protein FFLO_06753 [Filobasidium floriforme]|uniref:Uncharacterized protein n=1 Tax=Filobasidium floriforme TaxID=5210 RepID=A0A8K0NMQ4_9TREE|nr:hypothetical protein FFLO_06753 [Filobasidium floriforme]
MSSSTAPEANPPRTLRKVKSRKDALNKAINDHNNTQDLASAPPLPWTGSYQPPTTASTSTSTSTSSLNLNLNPNLDQQQQQRRPNSTSNSNSTSNLNSNSKLKGRASTIDLRTQKSKPRSRLILQTPASGNRIECGPISTSGSKKGVISGSISGSGSGSSNTDSNTNTNSNGNGKSNSNSNSNSKSISETLESGSSVGSGLGSGSGRALARSGSRSRLGVGNKKAQGRSHEVFDLAAIQAQREAQGQGRGEAQGQGRGEGQKEGRAGRGEGEGRAGRAGRAGRGGVIEDGLLSPSSTSTSTSTISTLASTLASTSTSTPTSVSTATATPRSNSTSMMSSMSTSTWTGGSGPSGYISRFGYHNPNPTNPNSSNSNTGNKNNYTNPSFYVTGSNPNSNYTNANSTSNSNSNSNSGNNIPKLNTSNNRTGTAGYNHGTAGYNTSTNSTSTAFHRKPPKKGPERRELGVGRHLRFEPEAPIMPDPGAFHMKDRVESLAKRILGQARLVLDGFAEDQHRGPRRVQHPELVPAFRWAVPFSPHSTEGAYKNDDDVDGRQARGPGPKQEEEEDHNERPKGFFLPAGLDKLHRDMEGKEEAGLAGWVKETTRYPRGAEGAGGKEKQKTGSFKFAELPDLFSRAHHLAAQSNGTLMIVTMHRSSDPADLLTDVYVTPGMSVDCAQLGEAAVQFKDNFDHLLNPQRWWTNPGKGNPEYTCEMERVVVDPLDPQDGWQRGMAGRHRAVLEAVFHGRPATVPHFVYPSQRPGPKAAIMTDGDLSQIVSFLIRSNPGGVTHPLGSQRDDEVSRRYQARFRSHQPAGPYLYEGASKVAEGTDARDAGYDAVWLPLSSTNWILKRGRSPRRFIPLGNSGRCINII